MKDLGMGKARDRSTGGSAASDAGRRRGADAVGVGRPGKRGWGARTLLKVYAGCCLFRILNTFAIQSYFDPDEFWQTLEPSYCLAFRRVGGNEGIGDATGAGVVDDPYLSCPGFTWEWKRRWSSSLNHSSTNESSFFATYVEPSLLGPARSHLPILPTYLLYRVLRYLEWDTSWAVARGPVILNAVLVASPVDAAVGYAASHLPPSNKVAYWCLWASLLSWFNGYSLVRTFSNSQETALLAISIALTAPELLAARISQNGIRRACFAFYLGGLSTAVRFTSLAAFVPMGVLLAHRCASSCAQQKHPGTRLQWLSSFVSYLVGPCAAFGLAGIATSVVLDRIMYGFWTVPFVALIHFNVVLNYAKLYGSHPWHWYFTAGLPAVSGLLLLPLLSMLFFKHGAVGGSLTNGIRNLWCILVSYVAIMSFNGHKEFRYIHPVLHLVCLLTGPTMRRWAVGNDAGGSVSSASGWGKNARAKLMVAAFAIANLVPVLYLGLFHQSGPVSVNRKIVEVAHGAAMARSASSSTTQSSTSQPPRYTVYYWTGECHSTPLHSHLHQPRNPSLAFDTWSLDCSPSCRADPDPVACETKQFQHDPVQFATGALCLREASEKQTAASAADKCRPVPDFVVTFSSYVHELDPLLRDRLGMRIVARHPFHLSGIALSYRRSNLCWEVGDGQMCHNILKGEDGDVGIASNSRSRSRRRIVGDAAAQFITLDIASDDVVLYSSLGGSSAAAPSSSSKAAPPVGATHGEAEL
jgi:GPI mannosyltransferase 3